MDRDSGVLVRVRPALCSDGVGVVGRVSRVYVAVLEDHGRIAKNKIYGAIYVTISVKLSL